MWDWELPIFSNTNGLAKRQSPVLAVEGFISLNKNLMAEPPQTFLYTCAWEEICLHQMRNDEFCSSLRLKTCPDLLESLPVGSTDSTLCRNGLALGHSIARTTVSRTIYNRARRCTRVRHSRPYGGGPAFLASISNQVCGAVHYSGRLAGASWPQTCSSSWLINIFVSENSSVDISHCMSICNNGRIRQHPTAFPSQNMKIHSQCAFLLLSPLSLFPFWSWQKAAYRNMILTWADNVFHPGTV